MIVTPVMPIESLKKISLFFLFFLFVTNSFSQIEGTVVDAETNKPIEAASVFLSGTSFGSSTKTDGSFVINRIPEGLYDLVISYVGFTTYTQTVSSAKQPIQLLIKLQHQPSVLQDVVVQAYDQDGWKKWGSIFIQKILGSSTFSSECKILNPEVIKFRNNKTSNTLTVFSNEDLLIENRALGYIIHYKLESFRYQFQTGLFSYSGFPFFEEMSTQKPSQQKRWQNRRKFAYHGSMMHFMRSVYNNTLKEEGFVIRQTLLGEDAAIKPVTSKNNPFSIMNAIDSVSVIELKRKNLSNLQNLKASDISFGSEAGNAKILFFKDFLEVEYTRAVLPSEFIKLMGDPDLPRTQISAMHLHNETPVTVLPNGCYYFPTDVVHYGFWVWSENISSMLPFNFEVSN